MTDLDGVYAQVPSTHCKGLCTDSCYSVGVAPAEGDRIRDRHGLDLRTGFYPDGCPALVEGRCSIYADRPLVCRLWGAVESMPCPYGCRPVVVLSDERGHGLLGMLA
jgi:hypothetical protein